MSYLCELLLYRAIALHANQRSDEDPEMLQTSDIPPSPKLRLPSFPRVDAESRLKMEPEAF